MPCPLPLLPLSSLLLAVLALLLLLPLAHTAALPSTCITGATPFKLADECAPGFYCPLYNASDATTYPVQCAPTDACTFRRLTSRYCDAQGTYEPVLCEEGHYCPTPLVQLPCPKGFLCKIGCVHPIECGAFDSCPEGSSTKTDLSSLIAILVVDVGLGALWYLAMFCRRKARTARDVEYMEVNLTSVNHALHAKGAAYASLPAHSKLLCQGFKRAQQELPALRLEFNELSMSIPPVKKGDEPLTILKGVTGSIEPGKVTAIMGPSGAGKTTFLTALQGRADPSWTSGGSLLVNGVSEPLIRFKKIIGSVPQEDIMHRDLTVYENIRYSASMRLPASWTSKQREDHVAATISAMQLKHVQDVRVGDEVQRGVSGGQRKRCNIGMEVAAAPSLLLLDEPTSGLDATASLEICQVLKDLARVCSLTVAMVIHQPRVEIWNNLDEVLLLAPGGLTVYQGPQKMACKYFAQKFDVHFQPHENPADALMDRIAEQADEFVRGWKAGGPAAVTTLRAEAKLAGGVQSISPPPFSSDDSSEADALVASLPGMSAHHHHSNKSAAAVADHTLIQVTPRRESFAGMMHRENEKPHALVSQASSVFHPAAFDNHSSLRHTAGFLKQIQLSFTRNLWKQAANMQSLTLEAGLGLFAGGIMGALIKLRYVGIFVAPYTLLSPAPMDRLIGGFMSSVGSAISLAAVSAGVSVFGEEQVIYRREVAAGHSHLAYYIGTNLAQLPRIFVDAMHFSFIFHILNRPLISFADFLAIAFLMYMCIYGLACIISFLVSRKNAPLLGVVLSLIITSMTGKGGLPEAIQFLSPSRWATEALFSVEAHPYAGVMTVSRTADDLGFNTDRFVGDMIIMFTLGVFYRLIAYGCMRVGDRKLLRSS